MELIANFTHRYIMHGFGWRWHRSHHRKRTGHFEKNDGYAVLFAMLAIILFLLGTLGYWPCQWIASGVTLYGVLYFVVHDGLVHQRWPFHWVPRKGYLRRLWLAHHYHHAVKTQNNAVSFGFLLVKSPTNLQQSLRENRTRYRQDDAKAAEIDD